MARAHFVKKARKDNPVCKAGESYWWWQFAYGPKQYSKEKPQPSQLTQSEFLGQMYELNDEISRLGCDSVDDIETLESEVESIVERLRELGEEQREKQQNMPEQLQDSETGQMLETRADNCDNAAAELENIDFTVDEGLNGEEKEQRLQEILDEIRGIMLEDG